MTTTFMNADAQRPARRFSIALAIIAASITTSLTVPPILPKMLSHFSDWPRATLLVALVVALPPLISTVAAPLIGALSDRIGRRAIVLWASLVSAMIGVLPYFLDSLWAILATRAFIGITTGALLVCTSAMIGDLFSGAHRQAVLGAKYAVLGIAHVTVFVVIGHLAETNWRNAFWIFLWGIAAAVLVALFVPREAAVPTRKSAHAPAANLGPVAIPWLRFTPVFIGVYLGLASFDVLLSGVPFLLVEHGIANTRIAGLTAAVASAGMFTGSLAYPFLARRVPGSVLWCVTFGIAALGYLILGSASVAAAIFAGTYIAGTGCGLVAPNSLNLLMSAVPAQARGRVAGVQTTFFFLGLGTGPLIGVSLAKMLGSSALLMGLLSGALTAITLTYAVLAFRARGGSTAPGAVQEQVDG